MTLNDFKPGDRVYYRPRYEGAKHEFGYVSSVNKSYIFVRFDDDPNEASKACIPDDLQIIDQ